MITKEPHCFSGGSIRLEEKLGTTFSEEQIDELIERISEYKTFLSFIPLFVAKGIKEVAEEHSIFIDSKTLEKHANTDIEGISLNDLTL